MLKKISVFVFVIMMSGGISFSEEQTPVEKYGLLRVKGTRIVDKAGNPVQLKGVSLYWSQWGFKHWNEDAISYIVKNWNVTVIRAPMGIAKGGYLEHKEEKELVKKVVDIAVKLGIYVIIDWHDHEASYHAKEAEAFFREMARRYKNTPNVMYEPYNEPLISESWESVKKYSERIIRIIRKEGAKNIILVGSPSWSRDVDSASLDPIKKYKDIAYTLHFYAGSHREDIREKAEFAMKRGIALFVTEWGTSIDTGEGGDDLEESELWIQFMDKHGISWCNWALSDLSEKSLILKSGVNRNGGWTDNDLTETGKFVKRKLLQQTAQ